MRRRTCSRAAFPFLSVVSPLFHTLPSSSASFFCLFLSLSLFSKFLALFSSLAVYYITYPLQPRNNPKSGLDSPNVSHTTHPLSSPHPPLSPLVIPVLSLCGTPSVFYTFRIDPSEMAVSQQNNRASLLAGLRTGGVRSTSVNMPHTAAPGATFNVPRFASYSREQPIGGEFDYGSEAQDVYVPSRVHQGPLTSAVDGTTFYQQSASTQINPAALPFTPSVNVQQAQSFQMQMMQMEILRLQVIFFPVSNVFFDLLTHFSIHQAQQYQVELLTQAQLQQQQQQQVQQTQNWRAPSNPPATAGPRDLRFSAAMNNQMRGNQAESLRSKLGVYDEPMTAALNGRFGSRKVHDDDTQEPPVPPHTPSRTTVISGGTVLGSPLSNNINSSPSTVPSKSDSAISWRRGGKNNSVLSGSNRATPLTSSPPSVKVTPPPGEGPSESIIPLSTGNTKSRPQPLRFSLAVSQPLPVIAIDSSEVDADDASSSGSSRSGGSPTTPSSHDMPPLSPREEATKRLYEGLGIGRPIPSPSPTVSIPQPQQVAPIRVLSQPMRQPKGPPSGADELGPKNFATRIRRKAIGGLGGLLETRERRDIEVY